MGGVALIVLSSDFDAIGTHGQAGQPIAASMGGPLLLRTFHRTSLVTVRERETPPTRRGGTAVKNTHPEQVSYKDPILRVDIISFLLRSQRANSRARAALDNLHSRQKSGSSFRPLHCDLLLLPPWSTWDFPHSKRLMQTSRISWKPPENPGQLDETKVDSHRNCRRHLSLLGREHCSSQLMLAVWIRGTHLPSPFIQALFITTDQDVLEAHRNLGCFLRFPTQHCTQKVRSPSESDEAGAAG